jgi:hypothetical protein
MLLETDMLDIDHIVISTPARDAMVQLLSAATALPALDGHLAGGEVRSRGVRFANGPFLDVFQAEGAQTLLALSGSIDKIRRLCADRRWAIRVQRRADHADPQTAAPWSILSFRRRQGVVSSMFIIEYERDPQAWTAPDYAGPLYNADTAPGATLTRVWLRSADVRMADADLRALGFERTDAISSDFAPWRGVVYHQRSGELVLCEARDGESEGVIRFDIAPAVNDPDAVLTALQDSPHVSFSPSGAACAQLASDLQVVIGREI